MRRPVFLLLLILLQITLPVKLSGQKPDYRLFDNISLGTEASVINCFLQDTQGLIWIGSNKGLFSYDGYSTQPHFTFAKRNNTQIYCGTVVDSTYLYLGADNGLLVYNYRTDTYEEPETQLPTDIRALLVHDGMLWLGTLNGLYTYSLNDHQLSAVTEGIPHQTIYSLIRSSDEDKAADAIEKAVSDTLDEGYRTGDIYKEGMKKVNGIEMTEAILAHIK